MAALAVWAKESGMAVTGSDVEESFPSDAVLAQIGISVHIGFSPDHIDHPDLVIYTGAHGGRDNIEVQEAIKRGIPTLPHGKALGIAMQGKRQISVAGSHGKTTTTAMIATVLTHAGLDPSYAVGCGPITGFGLSGHRGTGDIFVAEADEYMTEPGHDTTPRFLWQHPEILVVTNIDYDHPDAYSSLDAVTDAFVAMQKQLTGIGLTVVNGDDPVSRVLCEKKPYVSYGQTTGVDVQIVDIESREGETHFSLISKVEGRIDGFILHVPGVHNAMNATASVIAARALGVLWDDIKQGIAAFHGTTRRFENVGTKHGVVVYDDYAHHPKEIRATLAAARSWYPKRRIVCIFQPHTYSRTKSLMDDFAQAFFDADVVMLADIYSSAREHDTLGITSETLVAKTKEHHPHVLQVKNKEATFGELSREAKKGDVVLFMGAGDIYGWSHDYVTAT